MVLSKISQLSEWRRREPDPLFGDVPVCHLAFRWVNDPASYRGDELVCGVANGSFGLWLRRDEPISPEVRKGVWETSPDGELIAFGSELLSPGVWLLNPSLNIPGILHAYVTLYDVPATAPWSRPQIVIAQEVPS